jgi:hypothetical protein
MMPARSAWATLSLGVPLALAGVLLNNITFANRRAYWFAVPLAIVLMAAATAVLGARLMKAGWLSRTVSAILIVVLLQQISDAVFRRFAALMGFRF